MNHFSVTSAALLISAVAFWGLSVTALGQAPSHSFAIRDVRVFDGVDIHDRTTVLVMDGLIQSVSNDPVPAGFDVVEGSGQTLLPGLIDAHTHYWGSLLQQALSFGVTTMLNMSGPPAGDLRREQASGQGTDRADLFSADRMASPSTGGRLNALRARILTGLSGPFGLSVIASSEQADAFVADRVAEGSDYIKLGYSTAGDHVDGETLPMLRTIIEATHRGGKLAVVHALEQRAATEAIQAGADGLVHIFGDELPDPAFARLVAERSAFVVATLGVYFAPNNPWGQLQHASAAVGQLRSQGVPILAGSDGFPFMLHHELELLVMAGLTPREALVAATSASALSFGLEDRGRVAPGYRADLLLVRGNPTVDILATRDIIQVWKLGVPAAPIDGSCDVGLLVAWAGGGLLDVDPACADLAEELVPDLGESSLGGRIRLTLHSLVEAHFQVVFLSVSLGVVGAGWAGWFWLRRHRSARLR